MGVEREESRPGRLPSDVAETLLCCEFVKIGVDLTAGCGESANLLSQEAVYKI